MSFSSGAYFGSHSRVSQGRAASAFVVSLLVWIGPLSRTATRGRVRSAVPYAAPSWSSRATKSGGALGGAGMDEKAPVHRIKGAEHRPLFRLTGGLDAQLGAAPGPAARQIGMCERFGFVEEHQIDRPRRGLGFQISEALAAGRDRGCILAPFERVARPPPGKPLWRNWCESHRGEIVGPPRPTQPLWGNWGRGPRGGVGGPPTRGIRGGGGGRPPPVWGARALGQGRPRERGRVRPDLALFPRPRAPPHPRPPAMREVPPP